MLISNMYKKHKIKFLTKKLLHHSDIPIPNEPYLCKKKMYELDGSSPDISTWLPYCIGQSPENYYSENLKADKEGLHFQVKWTGEKITEMCISKLFDSYGHFRFLARFPEGKEGICSAPWLYFGNDYERGGFVEYDFEQKIQEKHSIHCANHLGFWYDLKFHRFSQRKNTLYKPSFNPTKEFYWYIFKVYPDRIEKWINNICVNTIFTHGQPDKLYAIFGCGVGGIASGDALKTALPVGACLKTFQHIPFKRDC